jgi:hypothetical protein
MDDQVRRAIETDCTRLMNQSVIHLDRRQYEPLAALFGPDGVWVRGGKPCTGYDGVMASLNERPADVLIRHLMTNIVVTVEDDSTATGIGYFLVYKATGDGGEPPQPAPIAAPAMVAEMRDTYRRGADGWYIARRETARIFA